MMVLDFQYSKTMLITDDKKGKSYSEMFQTDILSQIIFCEILDVLFVVQKLMMKRITISS
jgi:hypothetical protein